MAFYTKVVGVTYEGRQQIIRSLINQGLLQKGAELQLKRDIGNPYDSYAVAVLASDGRQIGYVPKDYSKQLSDKIASRINCRAYVEDITGGNPHNNYGLNIKIVEEENKVTKFRFEIHSESPYVFNVFVSFYNNNYQSSITTVPINDNVTSFQVNYEDTFDSIEVAFEEHLQIKNYKFNITEDLLGQEFGLKFNEVPDLYDQQTCAGGNFWFSHPNFEMQQIDFNTICIDSTPFNYKKTQSQIIEDNKFIPDDNDKECYNFVENNDYDEDEYWAEYDNGFSASIFDMDSSDFENWLDDLND